MAGRCRWQNIGRDDYEEPEPMSSEEAGRVSRLTVSLCPDRITVYDVLGLDGRRIGQVRTLCHGQYVRGRLGGGGRRAASDWDESDPPRGRALRALLDCLDDEE
ncbi:MAG: hypothetical protein DRQ14_08085 [Candidatus Latescibacterota bacterium]|nr:MAG: hypothetical protein DRQ14_08085 [Candidatus Latescibacterota bacterium]